MCRHFSTMGGWSLKDGSISPTTFPLVQCSQTCTKSSIEMRTNLAAAREEALATRNHQINTYKI
jgi:hypothetical protein